MLSALVGALKTLGKKVAIDVAQEPEKLLKIILGIGFAFTFFLVMTFNIPTIILSSIPSFFIGSNEYDPNFDEEYSRVLDLYANTPAIIDANTNAWINNEKKNYPNHEVVINDSSYIDWIRLISIDSVRFSQDFSKVSRNSITELANKFIKRSIKTESYIVQENVQKEETYYVLEPVETIETYTEKELVEKEETYFVTETVIEYYVEYKEKRYYYNSPKDEDGFPSRWYWESLYKWVTKDEYNANKEKYTIKNSRSSVKKIEKKRIVKEWVNVTKTRTVIEWVRVAKKRTITVAENVTKYRVIFTISSVPQSVVYSSLNFTDDQIENEELYYLTASEMLNYGLFDGDFDPSLLKEYASGSANLPYYNQGDARWGAKLYGKSGTIKDTGCGPTSLAMVVAGLTKNPNITPLTMANWSVANGHRAYHAGSYWSLMTQGGKAFGLKVENVSRKDPARIVEALSNGFPVIVSMGRGHFTNGGHFIVLRGLTDDGKVLVHDSASIKRSEKAWDLGIIMGESSLVGGVNGSPFWIFKP